MRKDFSRMVYYSILISIAINAIPSLFGITDTVVILGLQLVSCLILFLVLGNSLLRNGYFDKGRQEPHWKNLLILSPLIIFILGLPIVRIRFGYLPFAFDFSSSDETFWLIFVYGLVSAIYDELLFRLIIQQSWFANKTRIQRIIFSSLVYTTFQVLCNLNTIFLTSIAGALVAFAGYFLLGIVLAFLMEYTHSIYVCIVYGLLAYLFLGFSVNCYTLNAILSLVVGGIDSASLIFTFDVIVVMICEIFTMLYITLIYQFYLRRREY